MSETCGISQLRCAHMCYLFQRNKIMISKILWYIGVRYTLDALIAMDSSSGNCRGTVLLLIISGRGYHVIGSSIVSVHALRKVRRDSPNVVLLEALRVELDLCCYPEFMGLITILRWDVFTSKRWKTRAWPKIRPNLTTAD